MQALISVNGAALTTATFPFDMTLTTAVRLYRIDEISAAEKVLKAVVLNASLQGAFQLAEGGELVEIEVRSDPHEASWLCFDVHTEAWGDLKLTITMEVNEVFGAAGDGMKSLAGFIAERVSQVTARAISELSG